MMDRHIVHGAAGSRSVMLDATLVLPGPPYQVVERAPYDKLQDAEALAVEDVATG